MNAQPLPYFNNIDPVALPKQLACLLDKNRQILAATLQVNTKPTWALVTTLEALEDTIEQFWAPVRHLHAVRDNEALRAAYKACLVLLTEYESELTQNHTLYQHLEALNHLNWSKAQTMYLTHTLRDFRLAGVMLKPAAKTQLATSQQRLADWGHEFEANVLDATQNWQYLITDRQPLDGLPEFALTSARAAAGDKLGWLFTLDYPSYVPVMRYAHNRDLRKTCYEAYITRASDQGPHAGRYDNTAFIVQIINERLHVAKLLGFRHYAEYALTSKMAQKPRVVQEFLEHLIAQVRSQAQQEFQTLEAFAQEHCHLADIQPWDLEYVSERYRQAHLAISQHELKYYFPINQVWSGLLQIVKRLFGIELRPYDLANTWDPQVQVFAVSDTKQDDLGYLYLDLYARRGKRSGAWMDEGRRRRHLVDGSLQPPIAFLTCNFTPPTPDQPTLLSHEELLTLFHEFGHCLQHLLTTVDVAGVAGIRGVPWDAVEFPSQFLEQWAWQAGALQLCSCHVQTHEVLPKDWIERLQQTRHCLSAMQLIRQLEFALFDLRIHLAEQPVDADWIQQVLDEVRSQVAVVPIMPNNRFQHSFSHIFAGGYAAGYYGYLWAEMLASDAFAVFEEHDDIFSASLGQLFRRHILAQGGAEDPMVLFKNFRGREPRQEAWLAHHGIKALPKKNHP